MVVIARNYRLDSRVVTELELNMYLNGFSVYSDFFKQLNVESVKRISELSSKELYTNSLLVKSVTGVKKVRVAETFYLEADTRLKSSLDPTDSHYYNLIIKLCLRFMK